jgi:hypothetical protein
MQWFIAVVTPLGNDENRRLMIVQHNITERKLAEDALRKKETRTKSLVVQLETTQAELHEKVRDLETFHDLVVDRELRMIELKKENQQLRNHTPAVHTSSQGNSQPVPQATG